MKKITALLTLITFGSVQMSPLMAHIGGPYSGNTYDGYQGGVFHGTMTMKSGFGIFRFSTGFEPFISGQASSVVMVNGLVAYGDCFGFVDFETRTVSGVTNSLTALPGAVSNVGAPAFAFGNGTQDYVINTNWQGSITSMKPTVRFKGNGECFFFNDVYQDNQSTNVDRVEAAVDIPGPDGSAPGSLTQASSQVITDTGLAPMERRKIRVSGTRLSPLAYTGGANAVPSADARN